MTQGLSGSSAPTVSVLPSWGRFTGQSEVGSKKMGERSWHEQIEKFRFYFKKSSLVQIDVRLCWNVKGICERLWRFMNAKLMNFISHIDSGK